MQKKLLVTVLIFCFVLSVFVNHISVFEVYADSEMDEATQTDAEEIIELPEDDTIDNEFAGWPFKDVRQSDSGANEMLRAYNYGLMKGFGDYNGSGQQSFKPKKNVTRAQFAISLYNLANYFGVNTYTSERISFSDLKPNNTGYNEVRWCCSQGIIGGFWDGTFKPKNTITRAQMCMMLFRFAGATRYSTAGRSDFSSFADRSTVSKEMTASMKWAFSNNIMYGINRNGRKYIYPARGVSRAQAAMFLMRFVYYIKPAPNQKLTASQAEKAVSQYMGFDSYSEKEKSLSYMLPAQDKGDYYSVFVRCYTGTRQIFKINKYTGVTTSRYENTPIGDYDTGVQFNAYSYID